MLAKKKIKFYKKIFFFAALWNFLIAIPAIIFFRISPNLLFINPPIGEFYFTSLYIIFFANVLQAGIKYYKFSRTLKDFKYLIEGGMRGKVFLFIIGLILTIINRATGFLFLLVLGDLIWAVIFFRFRKISRIK